MGLLSVPSPKLTHSITWPSVSFRSYRHHSAGSHLQQEAARSQPWDCNRTDGPSEKRVLDNGHQDHNSWQTGPENVPTKAASGAREGDTFADQGPAEAEDTVEEAAIEAATAADEVSTNSIEASKNCNNAKNKNCFYFLITAKMCQS